MHSGNCWNAGNGTQVLKGATLKVVVASRPKLVFDQMALCMYSLHCVNYSEQTLFES
jgi:hypothetical protein